MGHHHSKHDEHPDVPVVPLYYSGVAVALCLAIWIIRAWMMRCEAQSDRSNAERSQQNVEERHDDDVEAVAGDAAERCPICLDPLRGEVAAMRACRHRMHRKCVEKWWATEVRARRLPTCPLCRTVTTNSVRHGQMQNDAVIVVEMVVLEV